MADEAAPDRVLAQGLAAGDRQACAELISRHHRAIYAFLARLCRDVHLAEDLTQETFAACWLHSAGFRGDCSLRTWLRRIAFRKFLDQQRRSRRRGGAPADLSAGPEPVAPGGDPLAALLTSERQEQLWATLATVQADDYQMLALHYLEGLSFQEMAQVLDEPVGTVKWRVSRALEVLRRQLVSSPTHECGTR